MLKIKPQVVQKENGCYALAPFTLVGVNENWERFGSRTFETWGDFLEWKIAFTEQIEKIEGELQKKD